jgi:D-inositol-3-phosphate glycosyltransferase
LRHLLVSYHTCPLEEPGVGLAGGMNVFLRGLLPGLASRGFSTDVLTRAKGRRAAVTRPFPGVRILHVPCGWKEPPSRESAYRALPRFAAKAREILAGFRKRPDAVSAHYWMSGVAARELGLPFVFMYHTVEAFKRASGAIPSGGLAAVRGEEEERLAAVAGRVVFFSEEDFARTRGIFPALADKGAVIPPGVDDAFRHPPPREEARRRLGVSPGEFLFLLAARPDPVKNVVPAMEAFRALRRERGPRIRLLVAGQTLPPSGLPEGAACAGMVPHAEMPELFSAADAVLCPSGYESFGLVPLEAVAAGVPVILPDSGFWGRRIRSVGGGLTYAPGSERGLLESMGAVFADGPRSTRPGKEGIRAAAPFTWATCAESWARLLSSLSRPGSQRRIPRAPAAPRRRGAGRADAS